MSGDQDPRNGSEDEVDRLARRAGAELRRPAPADGLDRVRSSRRRRAAARVVAGGSAVVVVAAVGLFVLVDPGGDDARIVTDSTPDTVTPDTVTPETVTPETVTPETVAATSTTEPTATAPSTAAPSTAAPAGEPGWRPADGEFPNLAYIACCATDWEGEPSPAVPTDPAAPLPPGTYNVRHAAAAPAVTDGVLTLEVRPYTRCTDLGEFECAGGPPYDDDDLGVPTDPARTVEVVLDASLRVAVSGFACRDDQLLADRQIAGGDELARLLVELDEAYATAVGDPLRRGVDPAQLTDDLAANPSAGFADPGCPSYTTIAWTPASGPPILARSLYRLDAAGAPEPHPSAAAEWVTPTALVVDERGGTTLYFYAGFLS